jgi:hypothetical protein
MPFKSKESGKKHYEIRSPKGDYKIIAKPLTPKKKK